MSLHTSSLPLLLCELSMATNGISDHPSPNPKDEHQLTLPLPNPGEVVPDLHMSPGAFLDYLKALSLEELTTAWQHLQKPLVWIASTQLYDEAIIAFFYRCLDRLYGLHGRKYYLLNFYSYPANMVSWGRDT